MISEKIEEFLKEYGNEIFKEHVTKLKAFQTYFKDVEATPVVQSKYGQHLSYCAWAYDDCKVGPDTCRCMHVEKREQDALKLMERYINLFKRLNKN